MTESSSSGLADVNGGARTLRKRDDTLAVLLLYGSSAIVLTNFRTTVLISVFFFVCLFVGILSLSFANSFFCSNNYLCLTFFFVVVSSSAGVLPSRNVRSLTLLKLVVVVVIVAVLLIGCKRQRENRTETKIEIRSFLS